MKFRLEVKPAINPKNRHAIEKVLEEFGYNVTGGGTHTDLSSCDISFERDDPRDNGKEAGE